MMIREVKRHDVEILMNTEVTPEFVKEFAPDAVILATGSVPACPPIKGIEHAHQAMAVYDGTCEPGKKVVMNRWVVWLDVRQDFICRKQDMR